MRNVITAATVATMVLNLGVAFAAAPVCGDVNKTSTITTTDALLVLKKSVSQPVHLDCSAYDNQFSTCSQSLSEADAALSTCVADLSSCLDGACGNAVLDAGEKCDQGNLNGKTCATQAPATPYGRLLCGAGCKVFDTSACVGRFEQKVVGADAMVVDHETGLEWIKTDDNGGLTDWNNTYTWSTGVGNKVPDGSAFTTYLAGLNAMNSGAGYGGHHDWRLPFVAGLPELQFPTANPAELESILDPSVPGCGIGGLAPCIDQTVFGPTQRDGYWSASILTNDPDDAWFAHFGLGGISSGLPKTFATYVRAVRVDL